MNNFPFFRFPFYNYPYYYQSRQKNRFKSNTESNSIDDTTNSYESKNYRNNNNNYSHRNTYIHSKTNEKNNYSQPMQNEDEKSIDDIYDKQEKKSKYNSFGPIFLNTNGFSDKEQPLIEILGLKLYLDDLIILSLLFFLYKEDVKDDMLFILLILLLLS